MKKHTFMVLWLGLATIACVEASEQYDQKKAFNDAKAYSSANGGLKAGVNEGALNNIPGNDVNTTNQLKNMYGSNLSGPGSDKISTCANYIPGSDGYKNQECATINFVVRNPSQRPNYTIDKVGDPLISRGITITNTPQNYTSGTSGLAGTYSACKDKTTNVAEQFDTERCQIGRPVTEGTCSTRLVVSYNWQRYAKQAGADLRYGYCDPPDVRGDELTIPLTNSYQTETILCSTNNRGTGYEKIFWYSDCAGNTTQWGYDASACQIKPNPVVSDPTHIIIQNCANAPRTIANCFTENGHFTSKVTVPVFFDSVDATGCADFIKNGAVITN